MGRRGLSNEEETGLRRIYRPDYRDPVEKSEEPELNPADIEEDLRRVQEQDSSMKSVNWNNLRETPVGHLIALFRALEYNQHVTEVNIGKKLCILSSESALYSGIIDKGRMLWRIWF